MTIDNGAGVGALNISNGGIYSGAPKIGLGTGAAIGTATINGLGSTWAIGTSYLIGAGGGLGTATVQQGGTVSSGDLFIGELSEGIVEISDNGSQWASSGSVDIGAIGSGRLSLYNGGSANIAGQLLVRSGGSVEVFGGTLTVASITLLGGRLENGGDVFSNGALTVSGAGRYSVSNGDLQIGGSGFSSASVTGEDSRIEANAVNLSSGGTLIVGTGASVSNEVNLFGGTVSGGVGGHLEFQNNATAGNGTFTSNGGTVSGAFGSDILFLGQASAGDSMLIANGGVGGGTGGAIHFRGASLAGTASVELYGNGKLDIGLHIAGSDGRVH